MGSKILGVDPGISGGLALIQGGTVLKAVPMPIVVIVPPRGRKKSEIDMPRFLEYVGAWAPDFVVIEAQQAMPNQGVSSTFTTGKNFGVLLGLLEQATLPVYHVRPQAWKKALGVTSDKQTAFDRADEIFPGSREKFWRRKKDDGICEAALIAYYGARKYETD